MTTTVPCSEPAKREGSRLGCNNKKPWAARKCTLCRDNKGIFKLQCKGGKVRGKCEFYSKATGLAVPCPDCIQFGGMHSVTCQGWDNDTEMRTCIYFSSNGTPN